MSARWHASHMTRTRLRNIEATAIAVRGACCGACDEHAFAEQAHARARWQAADATRRLVGACDGVVVTVAPAASVHLFHVGPTDDRVDVVPLRVARASRAAVGGGHGSRRAFHLGGGGSQGSSSPSPPPLPLAGSSSDDDVLRTGEVASSTVSGGGGREGLIAIA